MATLYLTEQGTKLSRESNRLLVMRGEEKLLEVPVIKLERVQVYGHIQVTTQALELLLSSGIPVAFLAANGKLKGVLEPVRSKNIPLRLAQYEKYRDEGFTLAIAKQIVSGKIRNQRRLIQRFAHNRPQLDFRSQSCELERIMTEVERKTTLGGLLGLEGRATAVYFEAYGQMFTELAFERRSRRPPLNPVNSLLSLGYTILVQEFYSACSAAGFDPYLGFFHRLAYGRPALALDLAEELRHPLIDMLTLDLANRRIITAADFVTESGGFLLLPEARKRYFAKYERRVTIQFKHPRTRAQTNVRQVIREQVQRMARAVQAGDTYEPFYIG
ncbi:MAG: CRISPR-associated endonuclease Cas1 [candidate division WOR-3 bacterium]